jgi:hypothetical protein
MTNHSTSPHADHDQLAVAALAAGDAEGAERERARQLVAECADCAELHADLQALQAATATLPAPVRTRDFRLTGGDAARLRPAGWRSMLAALRTPRLAFMQPLAVGMATLGVVGLLVASLPGPLLTATSDSGASTEAALPAAPAGTSEDMLKTEASAPADGAAPTDGSAAARPSDAPAPELAPGSPAAAVPGDRVGSSPGADAAGGADADQAAATGTLDQGGPSEVPWLAWLSAVLLVAGVGLLALGRLARRAG